MSSRKHRAASLLCCAPLDAITRQMRLIRTRTFARRRRDRSRPICMRAFYDMRVRTRRTNHISIAVNNRAAHALSVRSEVRRACAIITTRIRPRVVSTLAATVSSMCMCSVVRVPCMHIMLCAVCALEKPGHAQIHAINATRACALCTHLSFYLRCTRKMCIMLQARVPLAIKGNMARAQKRRTHASHTHDVVASRHCRACTLRAHAHAPHKRLRPKFNMMFVQLLAENRALLCFRFVGMGNCTLLIFTDTKTFFNSQEFRACNANIPIPGREHIEQTKNACLVHLLTLYKSLPYYYTHNCTYAFDTKG